jgi:hypothetical protein
MSYDDVRKWMEIAYITSAHISLAKVQAHRPNLFARESGNLFFPQEEEKVKNTSLTSTEHKTEGPSM